MEKLSNNDSTANSCGNISTCYPKVEKVPSPKRLFELALHGKKSQDAFLIDTAEKACHKTVFFEL
jgi:hypothetical protein